MKFFHSDMPGAPVLSGTAGALLAVLDACLVDGFGTKSATIVVASGVATATVTAPHTFVVGARVLVAGATPSGLNGEQVVTAITSTSVSFATVVANGSATGSITMKVAPLGWAKSHSGTNKAAYKSSAVESTGFKLRVDDTGAMSARVVGYESMTDVDTGSRAFPTDAQQTGGYYWAKSHTTDSTPRRWFVAGDERCVYVATAPFYGTPPYDNNFQCAFFGDPIAFKSGDAFCCVLMGNPADSHSQGSPIMGCVGYSYSTASPTINLGRAIARLDSGLGGSQPVSIFGSSAHASANAYSGAAGYGHGGLPNRPDNGLLVGRALGYCEGYRLVMPGLWHLIQNANGFYSRFAVEDGTGDLAGRKLMMLPVTWATNASPGGMIAFDITGPWR